MPDGRLPLGQPIEDGPAGRVGKRVEDPIKMMLNHTVEYNGAGLDFQPFG